MRFEGRGLPLGTLVGYYEDNGVLYVLCFDIRDMVSLQAPPW